MIKKIKTKRKAKGSKRTFGILAQPEKKNAVRPKTENDRAMSERNQIALAFIELAPDKTFKKLPEEKKIELVKEVLAIGVEVASWVLAEHGTNDPRKIASRLGVKVFGEDKGSKKASEYRKNKSEIVVYRDHHERLIREVKSKQLSEHLLKFLVAHELFHHLELTRIGEIYKRYTFESWQLGPYTRKKMIKKLSDVAAQAFTLSLLGLEISPEVFDYLTYILYTNPKA
ncbi:MAG: hypothetical protein ABH823_04605 [bacterium]